MTRYGRRMRAALIVLLAGAAIAAARPSLVAAKGPSETELLKRIEKGGTAQDHAALASYYRGQAKAAEKNAADHEAMAGQYVVGKTDWPTHCRNLASYYRKVAEEYEAMAKLHESHAAELGKKK